MSAGELSELPTRYDQGWSGDPRPHEYRAPLTTLSVQGERDPAPSFVSGPRARPTQIRLRDLRDLQHPPQALERGHGIKH